VAVGSEINKLRNLVVGFFGELRRSTVDMQDHVSFGPLSRFVLCFAEGSSQPPLLGCLSSLCAGEPCVYIIMAIPLCYTSMGLKDSGPFAC
jgi:hypothetical protein